MNRPNLLLVTIDSLRADHCGSYPEPPGGAEWTDSLTPTLDRLAGDGVVFANAVSPGPRTPSSMPVAMTGADMHAGELGVYGSWTEKRERWLRRRARIRRHMTRHRTVAERLRERGYATGAVTANPWTDRDTGFHLGFDRFRSVADQPVGGALGSITERLPFIQGHWLLRWPDFYGVVSEVLDRLEEPYFLWVFLLDPHQPYLAPSRYRDETTLPEMIYANLRYNRWHGYIDDLPRHLATALRRAYRDSIRSADGFLNRLLGDLPTHGREPVLLVHGDHGEAFGEHGFYGHRLQLYEESIHIPLVVSGAVPTGRERDPTSLRQLPQLIEGIADGRFEPGRATRQVVRVATEERERVALRSRRWKYIRGGKDWEYVRAGEPEELYNLRADRGERTNAVGDHSDARALYGRVLDHWTSDLCERGRVARAVTELEGI